MSKDSPKTGPNTRLATPLQFVMLGGVAVLIVVSLVQRNQLSDMEQRLAERLGRLESRLAIAPIDPASPATQQAPRPTEANRPERGDGSTLPPLVGVPASARVPDPDRVYTFDISRAPSNGPVDAPITIIEFSDFQCSFCRRAQPTIERLREVYAERIRWVWKHLPLEMHADAPTAHLASVAAANQGKFWEFKRRLFAEPGALKPDDLRQHAWELGLELSRFERDMATLESREIVEADMAEAVAIDLTATPGFFVNGRYIRGAKPFEVFAEAVDAELARLGLPIPDKGPVAREDDGLTD